MRLVRLKFNRIFQPVYALRRQLRLESGDHPLFEGQHSPRRVLALFSPLLAARKPIGRRKHASLAFAPTLTTTNTLAPALQQFLDSGDAPVLFTLGASSIYDAGNFFEQSLGRSAEVGQARRASRW
jgi:hypothetical protein